MKSTASYPVRECNACINFAWKKLNPPLGRNRFDDWATCAKGHTPTFKYPNGYDDDFGYRRRCGDFCKRRSEVTGGETAGRKP